MAREMKAEAGSFPVDFLKIGDIYLWSEKLERHSEYQKALHDGKTETQFRRALDVEMLDAVTAEGEHESLVRVLVTLGVRCVTSAGEEPLHSLESTFAVEYRVLQELPSDKMGDFVQFNCVHNAWPFWREHVYTTLKKASLPPISIPFFPARPQESKELPPKRRRIKKNPV